MRNARKPFPLRLPVSVHGRATDVAQREGMSLNQFVTLAIAEKLTRLEQAIEFQAAHAGSLRELSPPRFEDEHLLTTDERPNDVQRVDPASVPSRYPMASTITDTSSD